MSPSRLQIQFYTRCELVFAWDRVGGHERIVLGVQDEGRHSDGAQVLAARRPGQTEAAQPEEPSPEGSGAPAEPETP